MVSGYWRPAGTLNEQAETCRLRRADLHCAPSAPGQNVLVRGWILFWCVQSFSAAPDGPVERHPSRHELASDPYSQPAALAPNPYAFPSDTVRAAPPARAPRVHERARLASNPYGRYRVPASALLAPMPYAGRVRGLEVARVSLQAPELAASPYLGDSTRELAPDPY